MRLLSIDNIKEGMRLAKSIYSADGTILLAEDVSLDPFYIQRLKELGIASLYIVDNLAGKIVIDELVKIQTKIEAIKITKEVMNNIKDGRTMNGEKVRQVVHNIMDELLLNRNISFNLVDIRAMNDYNFAHGLTVCILSLMTGIALGYNYSKLKQLGTGAILHDVGKAAVPEHLLNKISKLAPDEFSEIQKHSQLGYEILQKYEDISAFSANVALQHHERFDGSGYPQGLQGNQIHEFARIVSLADVYDALSTDRVYRKRFLPFEAIEFIRDKGRASFDPELAKLFLANIAPFPIGSMVLLNSGEQGVVINISKEFPARPVVRIIFDKEGKLLSEPLDTDLKKDLSLVIIESVKD